MSFNYKHTCPDINKEIEYFKLNTSDNIDSIIEELNPLFYETEAKIAFRKKWEQQLYDDVESCFESVRECNSNIRDGANRQIKHAEEEAEEYKRIYEEARSEIETLQEEIKVLTETINDYGDR